MTKVFASLSMDSDDSNRMSFNKQRSFPLESMAWEDVAKRTELCVDAKSAVWYNAHNSHLSSNLTSA